MLFWNKGDIDSRVARQPCSPTEGVEACVSRTTELDVGWSTRKH
jgi:hypothetical protein